VSTYVSNRVQDLADPIPVGVGLGFGASAHATNYLQVGGLATARSVFYRARRAYSPIGVAYEGGIAPIWYFRDIETPDAGHEGRPVFLGRTLLRSSELTWHPWYSDNWLWWPSLGDYARNYDRHLLDFGFALYGIIGFEITLNLIQTPFEIADFFAGIAGFDPAGDDEHWVGPRLFDTAPPASEPAAGGSAADESGYPSGQ
jgi:hypothetical protein